MWETRRFENILKEKLIDQLGEADGAKYFGYYTTARHKLVENLLDEIKAIIPQLSDHGSRHIANVLDNIERLLNTSLTKYTGIELYCLGVATLFHDVGNIYGREKHNKKITEIYNIVRGLDQSFSQERYIITKIGEAHSGLGKDNTTDTLSDVDKTFHLDGFEVRMRELASILRLADELAEGKQRTSSFWTLIDPEHYSIESQIFHTYASICSVHIDGGNNRLSLSYNIELNELSESDFETLMKFIYMRIVKLDEERKYCKYYNDSLEPYKSVFAQFNFTKNGHHVDINLESLILNDIQKPGELKKKVEELNANYNIQSLWSKIIQD